MTALGPYRLTKPCANCPFRTDIRPYLHPERVDEIEAALVRSEFHCHKTVDYSSVEENDDGELDMDGRDSTGEAHCAGALILLEKLERPSQMMRIAERLALYDRRRIDMDAPVFDSFEDMREAMEMQRSRRRKRAATTPPKSRRASTSNSR